MQNCHLFFETGSESRTLSLFRLTYNSKVNNERKYYEGKLFSYIESADKKQRLMDGLYDKDFDEWLFRLDDLEFGNSNVFAFGMKYWPSYCNYGEEVSSGPYCFRPIDNLYEPLHYTDLKEQRLYNETQLVQKMVLYF